MICSVITLYNSEALAVMFTVCGWRVCDNLYFNIYCQNCAIHCCFTWGEKLVSVCNDQCWAIYMASCGRNHKCDFLGHYDKYQTLHLVSFMIFTYMQHFH